MKTKTCSKCKSVKPLSKFSMRKDTEKLNAKCKECVNLHQKEYRAKNIEAFHIKEQAYREVHRDHIRAQSTSKEQAHLNYLSNKESILKRHREYNAANAKDIRLQKKQYYKDNKQRILSRSNLYYLNNKDAVYARTAKRRAMKSSATPRWLTEEDWFKINLLYKIAHKVSVLTGVKMHVDHIYPLQGKTVCGLHCPLNLQVITATKNLEKGNSFPTFKEDKCPQ